MQIQLTDLLTLIEENARQARLAFADSQMVAASGPRIETAGDGVLARINGWGNLNAVPTQGNERAAQAAHLKAMAAQAMDRLLRFTAILHQGAKGPEPTAG